MSFKPHPPREPSSEKNRRRIRVRNAGHELNSESSQVSLCGKTHRNASEEEKTNGEICRDKTLKNKNNSQSDNLTEEKIPNCKDHPMHSKIMRQKWPDTKSSDNTSEFVDTGIGPDVPEIQSPRKPSMTFNVLFICVAFCSFLKCFTKIQKRIHIRNSER